MKTIRILLLTLVSVVLAVSCDKQLTPDKDIQGKIDEGEKVYAAKMEDVRAQAGLNRIRISGVLKYGMDTKKCVITWKPGDGKAEVPVERKSEVESFEYFVDGLDEGTYDFVVTTYDKDDHASIPTSVSGKAYGSRYLSTLTVRSVLSCTPVSESLIVSFAAENANASQRTLTYLDADGESRTAVVPKTSNELTLFSWLPESEFVVNTYYMPEVDAVDEFVVSEKGAFPEKPVDKIVVMVEKSGFAELILDNDIHLDAWAGALWKGWDGNKTASNFAHSDNTSPKEFPFWYTFDMGQTCQLCKYVHYGNPTANRIYDGGSLKSWEIYGRADYPSDSSWDGWTKLVSCESFKPSGNPVGNNTQEDIDRWLAGEEFEIPTVGLPQVRYIRVKVLDTWSHEGWILFSEFEFYKYE